MVISDVEYGKLVEQFVVDLGNVVWRLLHGTPPTEQSLRACRSAGKSLVKLMAAE